MDTVSFPKELVANDAEWARSIRPLDRALQLARANAADCFAGVHVRLAHSPDPLQWLQSSPSKPRGYWRARWSNTEYAFSGAADRVSSSDGEPLQRSLETVTALLRRVVVASDCPAHLSPRCIGGAAFDPSSPLPDDWTAFGSCTMILPEALLSRHDGQTNLLLIVQVMPTDDQAGVIERLNGLIQRYCSDMQGSHESLPSGQSVSPDTERNDWLNMVGRALDVIQSGRLQKVVLSRSVQWQATEPIPMYALLQQMRADSQGLYCYAFQAEDGSAFVSATPERLVYVAGGEVETDCIAGTVSRGVNAQSDDELARGLLTSGKDRREHGFVVEGVVEALRELCVNADVGAEPWTMRLPTVQHLVTTAHGQLRPGVSVAEIISRLHPTAAVGGTPRREALNEIRSIEPRGRGWYGGPIGWMSADAAEFAVGIRSGLISGNTIRLFAGAGIVAGSSPEREWDETELKAQSLLKMLHR